MSKSIEQLAREAGFYSAKLLSHFGAGALHSNEEAELETIKRLHALAIAEEHKRLLEGSCEGILRYEPELYDEDRVRMEMWEDGDWVEWKDFTDQMAAAVLRATLAERERCAQLCDAEAERGANVYNWGRSYTAEDIAAAIRGQQCTQ